MADTWAVPGYSVPSQNPTLSFPGIPYVSDANAVPISFDPSVPPIAGGGNGLSGLLGSVLGIDMGTPTVPVSANNTSQYTSNMGGWPAVTPPLQPGQSLTQSNPTGNAGTLSGISGIMAGVLGSMGLGAHPTTGTTQPAPTPVSYQTGAGTSSATTLLMIGAVLVGGFLLLKHH